MENIENVKPARRYLNDEFLHFQGSEIYHSYLDLYSKVYLSEGVKHITDKCGMQWFLDTILFYQRSLQAKAGKFQIWTLERVSVGEKAGQWRVVLYLDDIPVIKQQFNTISLLDNYEEKFDVFKIYLDDNILFLPSEY
jgi:hypothetical protein